MGIVVQVDQEREECEKIHVETEAFWQMYSELQQHYLGEYVAVYQQQVVDHDHDVLRLEQRVVERFGDTIILFAPVTAIAKRDLQRRGFRLAVT